MLLQEIRFEDESQCNKLLCMTLEDLDEISGLIQEDQTKTNKCFWLQVTITDAITLSKFVPGVCDVII